MIPLDKIIDPSTIHSALCRAGWEKVEADLENEVDKMLDGFEILEEVSLRDHHRWTLRKMIVAALMPGTRCFTLPDGSCVTPQCMVHSGDSENGL